MGNWNLVPGYVDCHVHLADQRFQASLEEVLGRAQALGIHNFALGGVDPKDWERAQGLAKRHQGVFPSFGLHPYFVSQAPKVELEEALVLLESHLSNSLGLGECGLDHREKILGQESREIKLRQRDFFERQLTLARLHKKVPVLHVVRAHTEALDCLRKTRPRGYLLHSFHAEVETSKKHLDLGAYLSISGSILRPNAHRLEDSLRSAPMERILLESDAPDQNPDLASSLSNEPTTILLVAERIAELKNCTREEVLERTRANFCELFQAEFLAEEVFP